MANSILLQGVTRNKHLDAVRHLLRIPNPERVILSVGFMNEGGLASLEEELSEIAGQTTIVAGIRNGITSVQGLRRSLDIGCTTYVVDTGSRNILFHPKVYLSRNADAARLIVGSANLTVGGLNSNIEASISMEMDLSNTENASLIADLESKIDGMIAEYPKNIFQVTASVMLENLMDSGRLVDESIRSGPTTTGSSSRRDLDTIPKMKLKTRPTRHHRSKPFSRVSEGGHTPQPTITTGTSTPVRERLTLVWQSKPLKRRHLTIPTGATTNPTGSMLLGKGEMDGIDQRHYFRDEVFAQLNWQFDKAAKTKHMERAEAKFQLVIRDVSYGMFDLRLSHNSRTDTKAYEQRNSMTQLHWGEARQIIAREDLLSRTASLYRDSIDEGSFVLEID